MDESLGRFYNKLFESLFFLTPFMIDKALLRNEDGKPLSGMGTLGKWKFLRQFHLKIERWERMYF